MKTFKLLNVLAILLLTFSCSSDDDMNPLPVNEEELITTVKVVLTHATSSTVTLTYTDLDGDGSGLAVIDVDGDFDANTNYTGTVQFLNETESPAEDITLEVEQEADEHQVFYTFENALNITAAATDVDGNNNLLGLEFSFNTGAASSGAFTLTLRHEPTKPNFGLSDAGGETDVEVTFNVNVI
ncbi:type 1 periplasmic binding fold superfamily protein [Aurantibacter sp.]|uniref:type 1 periplasmic binding fold superfamily protein n=1 Tax=Aurantibacter sp. TaxID=2807103 RepID=UPI0035C796E1